jgi:hypothetical protein
MVFWLIELNAPIIKTAFLNAFENFKTLDKKIRVHIKHSMSPTKFCGGRTFFGTGVKQKRKSHK